MPESTKGRDKRIFRPIKRRYGLLTILHEGNPKVNGRFSRIVWCRCSCVNKTIKTYRLANLKSGITTSCGCERIRRLKETHAGNKYTETHGWRSSPLYMVWYNMIRRCTDDEHAQYDDYGGRGITVCKQWISDVDAFCRFAIKKGWKKGLQIDRIDNDGNYTPTNVRFVTPSANSRNSRANHLIHFEGNEYPLIVAVEMFAHESVNYATARARIARLHWTVKKALVTPTNRWVGTRV